ncbi:hypothetical protein [Nocardia sp. NPDC003979]
MTGSIGTDPDLDPFRLGRESVFGVPWIRLRPLVGELKSMNLTTLEVVLTLLLVLAVAAICGLVTYIVAKSNPAASPATTTPPNPGVVSGTTTGSGDAVLRGFAAVGAVILIGVAVIGVIAMMI